MICILAWMSIYGHRSFACMYKNIYIDKIVFLTYIMSVPCTSGAVIGGADSEMLRDLMLLDCLGCSIGVLTWSPLAPPSNSHREERY